MATPFLLICLSILNGFLCNFLSWLDACSLFCNTLEANLNYVATFCCAHNTEERCVDFDQFPSSRSSKYWIFQKHTSKQNMRQRRCSRLVNKRPWFREFFRSDLHAVMTCVRKCSEKAHNLVSCLSKLHFGEL